MDAMTTHEATTEDAAAADASRFPLAIRTQRVFQIVLGLFWIFDAALQFQPFMFGNGFVTSFILPNAAGPALRVG